MNFRIINIDEVSCPQLLLQVALSEDSDSHIVGIAAWHDTETDGYLYQAEYLEFPNIEMAQRFVEDYSELSAYQFVQSFQY